MPKFEISVKGDTLEELVFNVHAMLYVLKGRVPRAEKTEPEPELAEDVEPAKPAKSAKKGTRKSPKKKAPTEKDAREAFAQVLEQCGRDAAKACLAEVDALKFTGVDPKDYAKFVKVCNEALEADE